MEKRLCLTLPCCIGGEGGRSSARFELGEDSATTEDEEGEARVGVDVDVDVDRSKKSDGPFLRGSCSLFLPGVLSAKGKGSGGSGINSECRRFRSASLA